MTSPLLSSARWLELWRYYQAGVVNTLFGFGLYAVLVHGGMNIFAAQIVSHFSGAAFNYVTYSRHVFRDAGPAKLRFALSYVVNYAISVAALAVLARAFASPYVAGLLATLITSLINYAMLKLAVFVVRRPA